MFNIDIFLATKASAVKKVYGLQMEIENVLLFEMAKTVFCNKNKNCLASI